MHQKTGLDARVLALSKKVWAVTDLEVVLAPLEEIDREIGGVELPVLDPSVLPPVLDLPPDLRDYVGLRPPKAERQRLGIDGSRIEQRPRPREGSTSGRKTSS